jgi:hypothetical protein
MFGGESWKALWLAALALWALPAWAEEEKEQPAKKAEEAQQAPQRGDRRQIQRVFQLKYIDPQALSDILRVFPGVRIANRSLKTLSVSGSPDVVAAVEEAVKRFDAPPPATRNIDLTVHLLGAQQQAGPSEEVPPALQGVVGQLKGLFPYQGYRLMETFVMRTRDGRGGEISGIVPTSPSASQKTFYSFSIGSAAVSGDEKDRKVRIDGLDLRVDVPFAVPGTPGPSYQYRSVGLKTDIDIREGQKVVVGKATVGESTDALILVLTAKILD